MRKTPKNRWITAIIAVLFRVSHVFQPLRTLSARSPKTSMVMIGKATPRHARKMYTTRTTSCCASVSPANETAVAVPRATAMFLGLPPPMVAQMVNERRALNPAIPSIHPESGAGSSGPCRLRNFRTRR